MEEAPGGCRLCRRKRGQQGHPGPLWNVNGSVRICCAAAAEGPSLTFVSERFSVLHGRAWSCALVSPSLKWGYFLLLAMVVAKVLHELISIPRFGEELLKGRGRRMLIAGKRSNLCLPTLPR